MNTYTLFVCVCVSNYKKVTGVWKSGGGSGKLTENAEDARL